MQKDFNTRLNDLKSHTTLLLEACERFIKDYKLDEIKNIGLRLRALVGAGKGNGLLFELAQSTGDKLQIMVLNQYGSLRIREIENGTNRVVQEVEKKTLITQIPGRLPIVFSFEGNNPLYRHIDLKDWIETGFLLDWDVPNKKGTSEITTFTPQNLINRYTGHEGAHSDSNYGVFGGPVENLTMQYSIGNKNIVVPIVYEYLYQIGKTVAEIALKYLEKHKCA